MTKNYSETLETNFVMPMGKSESDIEEVETRNFQKVKYESPSAADGMRRRASKNDIDNATLVKMQLKGEI